jgi:hypothetical protein
MVPGFLWLLFETGEYVHALDALLPYQRFI